MNLQRKPLVQEQPLNETEEKQESSNNIYQEFLKQQANSKDFFSSIKSVKKKKEVQLKINDVKKFIGKLCPLKRKQILKDFQEEEDMKDIFKHLSKDHLIYLSQCRIRKQQEVEIQTNYLKFLLDKEKADKFDLTSLRRFLKKQFLEKRKEQLVRNGMYRPDMELNRTGGMFSRYKSTDLLKNRNIQHSTTHTNNINKSTMNQTTAVGWTGANNNNNNNNNNHNNNNDNNDNNNNNDNNDNNDNNNDNNNNNNNNNKQMRGLMLEYSSAIGRKQALHNNIYYKGRKVHNSLEMSRHKEHKSLKLSQQVDTSHKHSSFYRGSLLHSVSINHTKKLTNLSK